MTTQVKPTSMQSTAAAKGQGGDARHSGMVRMLRFDLGGPVTRWPSPFRSRNTGFQLMLPLPVLSDFAARTNAPPHSLEPRLEID
jgi:hypothetical protein